MKKILKNYYAYILLLLMITVATVAVGYMHSLFADEREHLYATYMISLGNVPYLDFFEHHHPLMWYLFAPILNFFGDTVSIWYILRTFMLLGLLVTAVYVYHIIRLLTENIELGLIGVAWFLGNNVVAWAGTEYRPDNLMVMFHTMGLYYLLKYLKQKTLSSLQISVMCFFLSLLALQKVVVLWVPLGVVVLYFLIKGEIKWKSLCVVMIFPCLYAAVLLIKMYQLGMLEDYWILNWLLNGNALDKWEPPLILWILPFVASVCGGVQLWQKQSDVYIKSFAFMFLVTAPLLLVVLPVLKISYLYSQYFLPIYPLMAVVLTVSLKPFLKYKKIVKITIFCVIAYYGTALYRTMNRTEQFGIPMAEYLDGILYEHSKPTDEILCNIDLGTIGAMRRCAQGYFFFSYGMKAAEYSYRYNRKILPRLNEIIKSRMPKIVANNHWPDCGWNAENQKVVCRDAGQLMDIEWMKKHYTYNGFIWIRSY